VGQHCRIPRSIRFGDIKTVTELNKVVPRVLTLGRIGVVCLSTAKSAIDLDPALFSDLPFENTRSLTPTLKCGFGL
jgi:hypothetical protein